MLLLLLTGAQTAAPAPPPAPPAPVEEHGSPWGPWKPIRVRPLVTGSIRMRIPLPTLSLAGDVHENEDWLLGLPTETSLL